MIFNWFCDKIFMIGRKILIFCLGKEFLDGKIFNKLYENIITGNVYGQRQEDSEALERNEYYKLSSWYQNNVKDGIITVYSDVYPINCPNIVRLKKYENKI